MGTEEDTLEQAAAARAERLRALKAAALTAALDRPDDSDRDTAEQEDAPSMKFRNYVPQDKELNGARVAPPEIPKFEDPVASAPPPTNKAEDPFLNIAPKKPNWDLRRDVQKNLDKLDRRMQKALFKIMEEHEKEKLMSAKIEAVAEE